jgi:hypothetical protein
VHLEWADSARIDQVTVYQVLNAHLTEATLITRVHIETVQDMPLGVNLEVEVAGSGTSSRRSNSHYHRASPRSRYPSPSSDPLAGGPPYGAQPLYDLGALVSIAAVLAGARTCRTGLRSIVIDRSAHAVGASNPSSWST